MDIDTSSNSGVSAASPDRFQDGRASSVSLDDPDVRMAAEALGDLRADFVSSPPGKHTPLPASPPHPHANGPRPEPLISLLTTSHPFLATTIEGATSAYNNSKNYSPRFKTSAEYVEGYVIPIANTVGSVGRVTGVEGGVRWFLSGGNRHKSQGSDLEAGDQGSNKRRKVGNGSMSFREKSPEPESGVQTPRASSLDNPLDRRLSVASTIDTLPAYDEARSPPYAEHFAPPETRPHNAAWQSRLIMSTSGLSIAMSEESLRSLKYCLSWLRWANEHIGNVINSLKRTMEKYEHAKLEPIDGDHPMQGVSSNDEPADRHQLAAKITDLKSDVLKTLQDVINTVSRYAGGALPENARELVRRHLTSLPQRFRVASMMGSEGQQEGRRTEVSEEEGREAHEKETRESAQRVLVLAKEGLDMMSQVSGVLDGTIVSAEEWCDRLGRRKREQREDLLGVSAIPQVPQTDTKMS
ncbi:transcription factor Opi1 [Biscogniauxia marginata]|nr:transcription factor Opi1 [Biscogniauxia marginata]